MQNKLHFYLGLFPLIVSLLITLVIIFFFKYLPVKLPLFYSIAWGEGQLATQQQFFFIPLVIVLTTVLNLIISWQLHSSQSFLREVLHLSSVFVCLVLTLAFVKIVLLFI